MSLEQKVDKINLGVGISSTVGAIIGGTFYGLAGAGAGAAIGYLIGAYSKDP